MKYTSISWQLSKRNGSQMALGFHETEVCPLLAHTGSSDCHTGEPSQPSKKVATPPLGSLQRPCSIFRRCRCCHQWKGTHSERLFFFPGGGGLCILSVCPSKKHPCSGTGALNKSYLFTFHGQSKWIYGTKNQKQNRTYGCAGLWFSTKVDK